MEPLGFNAGCRTRQKPRSRTDSSSQHTGPVAWNQLQSQNIHHDPVAWRQNHQSLGGRIMFEHIYMNKFRDCVAISARHGRLGG